jgi:peroxin-6
MLDFCRGGVVCNPALSYNLGSGPLGSDVRFVSIIASSFGPLPPPLPTARSVTVAQIMSPPGSANPHGSSLLSGMQKYFRESSRLVKRGDVLVIPTEIDPLTIHVTTALSEIPHVSDDNL